MAGLFLDNLDGFLGTQSLSVRPMIRKYIERIGNSDDPSFDGDAFIG
jgi:hypothetical protein